MGSSLKPCMLCLLSKTPLFCVGGGSSHVPFHATVNRRVVEDLDLTGEVKRHGPYDCIRSVVLFVAILLRLQLSQRHDTAANYSHQLGVGLAWPAFSTSWTDATSQRSSSTKCATSSSLEACC